MVKRIQVKMAKLAISVLLDTPTPRHRSSCLGVELRLGGPEPGFLHFLVRLGIAMLCLFSTPRRICKFCFGSSLPLILTIVHCLIS